jgi:hypothetical protein
VGDRNSKPVSSRITRSSTRISATTSPILRSSTLTRRRISASLLAALIWSSPPSSKISSTSETGPPSVGLRYDHYQLLLNEYGFSPRLSIARNFPTATLLLHASFDRIFQTPSFENILVSCSPQVDALSDQFLRLPVKPSRGNYWEGGLAKALFKSGRLDLNIYRRDVLNFSDDDQLLNTGVSYPISFDHGIIYGAEGKFELVDVGKLSGFVSHSYLVGNVWLPVTGGLFLGQDAGNASTQLSGQPLRISATL